jgi:hypothetical protein
VTSADGRVWLHGCTLDPGGQPDKHFIFAIEPDAMRTEIIPIPERSYKLNARIFVTSTQLLFVCEDFLAVRDRATGRWDTYKEIKVAALRAPLLAGDSLYLIVSELPGNALIRFDLHERTAEVLASTRRRPAASPFDNPGIEIKSVTGNEAGEIIVVAGDIRQAWNRAQRSWTPLPPQTSDAARSSKSLPVRPEYGRVGTIRKVGGIVAFQLYEKDAPLNHVPVEFAAGRIVLPESRYGPQNIRPDYCTSFPGGLLLTPSAGCGFWILTQKEIDDYLQHNTVASRQ